MNELTLRRDKNIVKIWPYLDDLSSFVYPYRVGHLSQDLNRVVNLDFSKVKRINSSVAAFALLSLCQALNSLGRVYRIVMPEDTAIMHTMQDICFFSILSDKLRVNTLDLFQECHINREPRFVVEHDEARNIRTTSFPIYTIRYDKNSERKGYKEFSRWVLAKLHPMLFRKYDVDVVMLIELMNEMVKNTQDHAQSDALLGLTITENLDSRTGELAFSCGDFGIGIHGTVLNYLRVNEVKGLSPDAWRSFSIADSYQMAFTRGFSTYGNKKHNKGLGLPTILDLARELGLDLSALDTQAFLLIDDDGQNTHAGWRQRIFSLDKSMGFGYYGRLKF